MNQEQPVWKTRYLPPRIYQWGDPEGMAVLRVEGGSKDPDDLAVIERIREENRKWIAEHPEARDTEPRMLDL